MTRPPNLGRPGAHTTGPRARSPCTPPPARLKAIRRTRRSFVCRVVRSTSETVDPDVVNLAALAVHQNRSAFTADKINGGVTGIEDRRHVDSATDERWGDEFETETSMRAHR